VLVVKQDWRKAKLVGLAPMNKPLRRLAALVPVALYLQLAPAAATAGDLAAISPGVKIGWTGGRGFTYGVELSFIWDAGATEWNSMPYAHGLVFDLDSNFDGFWRFHAGYEAIGPFVGLDVGPTLVGDRGNVLFGLGFTPWAGYDVIPYYSYTFAFGGEQNFHELGTYLKLALSPDGNGSQSGSSWDHHHHHF
jgi:hypothetical protein